MLATACQVDGAAGVGSVRIEVTSVVVRLALLYVADEAGWTRCREVAGCRCLRVADRLGPVGSVLDVLVVRDDPASCQEGTRAVLAGRVRSIVLWDEPETLAKAIEAVRRGASLLPQRAIELSLVAPSLTDRQRETLRLLAGGRSSRHIAQALHQSESTAKRDIGELLGLFDAPNRTALVSAAAALGFMQA